MDLDESKLLTTAQAAAYIGVTQGTLEVWRCVKRYDLPHLKIGRLVKYRRRDLDVFLENCVVD
jgi:excisionase family DNA binding protein